MILKTLLLSSLVLASALSTAAPATATCIGHYGGHGVCTGVSITSEEICIGIRAAQCTGVRLPNPTLALLP